MRKVLAVVGLCLLLAGPLAAGWVWWSYPLPDLGGSTIPTVRILAGRAELALYYAGTRRAQVWVPLQQIPEPVVNAILAAEDRRFFQHRGIDLLAVLRATAANLRSAEVVQGGSTITQQLARTLFLGNGRTWARKLREAGIAVSMELRYPKAQILEAYLNNIYMGHDGEIAVHGVGAAARHFLGKELAAVRLEDAALLAGAIRAPNRVFSGDTERARARRDFVLRVMSQEGMVSEAAAGEAAARPLRRQAYGTKARAPYFVDLVREEIAQRVALPPSGEVRIATSLDTSLQRAAEAAIRDGLERIERRKGADLPPGKLQAALVAIEPASGQIRALVGGRRYRDSQFNRAVRAVRQPGSLFKPFVYLAAFEGGRRGARLTPASLIADEPIAIQAGNTTWSPQNIDGQFHGPVTVRRALEQSLNVPAARVADDVGLDRVTRVAQALGIESKLSPVPSLALGTSEVTLLEITGAFAALANEGVRVRPTTLDLEALAVDAPAALPPRPVQAVSAESAFLITHLLRGVMRHGTAGASARWGLSEITAGKTGTTDDLRDAWFIGYTRDLAVGVWVGTDDSRRLGLTGAQAALPIWATVMQAAVRRSPPRPFSPPAGIVMVSVERDTGRLASVSCGSGPVISEAFLVGSQPQGVACAESATGHGTDGSMEGLLDWVRGLFR